jgi:hypothetical protein
MKISPHTRVGGRMSSLVATSFALHLIVALLLLQTISGFVTSPSPLSGNRGFGGMEQRTRELCTMGAVDPVASSEETQLNVQDKNGKLVTVGTVIRVASENVKAYQVPGKGQGSFNEKKEFVPAPEDSLRAAKNLALPVGLQGVVKKIYDVGAVTANFSIQVKFTPGENIAEGFDTPVPFLHHFDSSEIEIL